MGTRADFYVGTGKDAEWLGSVAWDGYEWNDEGSSLRIAKTEDDFREAVEQILSKREDATRPAQGWPWPWEDSRTTDYAYAFEDGETHVFSFEYPPKGWPNMKDKQNVTFGKRSGVMIVSVPRKSESPNE